MKKPLGPGPFTCQTCAKQFNKPSIYKSHLKVGGVLKILVSKGRIFISSSSCPILSSKNRVTLKCYQIIKQGAKKNFEEIKKKYYLTCFFLHLRNICWNDNTPVISATKVSTRLSICSYIEWVR